MKEETKDLKSSLSRRSNLWIGPSIRRTKTLSSVFSHLQDKGVGGCRNYEAFLYRPQRSKCFTPSDLREKGVIGANDAVEGRSVDFRL